MFLFTFFNLILNSLRKYCPGRTGELGMVSEGWDKTDMDREEQDRHGQARTGPDRNS